jgi:uncharacterized protein
MKRILAAEAFVESKILSDSEWESLCNQCGQCCYIWLDNNTRSSTETCLLLDKQTNKCIHYENRFNKKSELYFGTRRCVKLIQEDLKKYCDTKFLPDNCAYIQYYLKG